MKFLHAVLAAALFGVVFAYAQPAPAADVDPELANAEALLDAGKYSAALKAFDTYIAGHPEDARAYVDRADTLIDLGKPRESVADYTKAIEINPQYAYALASRCDAYYQIDRDRDALIDCDRALSLKPNDAYALRVRALVRDDLKDFQGAQDDATASVDAAPDSAYSLATRCRVLMDAGKGASGEKDCLAALAIDPKNYRARFALGRIQISDQRWTDAESTFSMLLDEDATDEGSEYWRAIARYHQGKNEPALVDINGWVKGNVDDAGGYYVRALIEKQLGDLAKAKTDATTAVRHYLIDNDTAGAAKAQLLLDELNGKS